MIKSRLVFYKLPILRFFQPVSYQAAWQGIIFVWIVDLDSLQLFLTDSNAPFKGLVKKTEMRISMKRGERRTEKQHPAGFEPVAL